MWRAKHAKSAYAALCKCLILFVLAGCWRLNIRLRTALTTNINPSPHLSLSLSLSSSKYVGFLIHAVEATIGIVCKMRFVIRTLIIAVTGKEICPTSEIVFLPVLIFTYSHVENALFFA